MKCKKCGNDEAYDEDDLCRSCERARENQIKYNFIAIGAALLFLGAFIGVIIGHVDYGYELSKCSEMTIEESAYDFSHTLEIDAEFNSDCYSIRNHPLAYAKALAFTGLLGLFMMCIPCIVLFGIYMIKYECP